MNVIDDFIKGVLNALPEDGLNKLEALIDEGNISERALNDLMEEYDIDPATIMKERGVEGA